MEKPQAEFVLDLGSWRLVVPENQLNADLRGGTALKRDQLAAGTGAGGTASLALSTGASAAGAASAATGASLMMVSP
jgi:hypothetical protein